MICVSVVFASQNDSSLSLALLLMAALLSVSVGSALAARLTALAALTVFWWSSLSEARLPWGCTRSRSSRLGSIGACRVEKASKVAAAVT